MKHSQLIQTYDNLTSFERKILFSKEAGKSFFGTFVSEFRIPTGIRKLVNKQISFYKDNKHYGKKFSNSELFGCMTGVSLGVVADVTLSYYALEQAFIQKNYTPLAILGVSNLSSLLYETGRFKKSKKEYFKLEKNKSDFF
jgi:hypothetical protein